MSGRDPLAVPLQPKPKSSGRGMFWGLGLLGAFILIVFATSRPPTDTREAPNQPTLEENGRRSRQQVFKMR